MKARKLTRKSPPATAERIQGYVDWIGEMDENWGDSPSDVDVDAEVRLDHRPVDTEAFSLHTDGIG